MTIQHLVQNLAEGLNIAFRNGLVPVRSEWRKVRAGLGDRHAVKGQLAIGSRLLVEVAQFDGQIMRVAKG